jgi:hypothetical protein
MAFYRPLNDSIHEIRVLHILPQRAFKASDQTQGQVECLLEYVSLNNSPSYHALSYTWQLPDSDVPFADREPVTRNEDSGVDIILDGNVVSVTFNLWSALKQFQYLLYMGEESEMFPRETRLWVDAICINQLDFSERNTQVRQMRQIYQKARCVNAWLGPEASNSSVAMEFAKIYNNHVRNNGLQGKESLNRKRSKLRQLIDRLLKHSHVSEAPKDSIGDKWIAQGLKDPASGPSWIALAALYGRSY